MEPLHPGAPAPQHPQPPHSPAQHEEHVTVHIHTHGGEEITIDIAEHHRHRKPHPRPDPGQEVVYVLTIDGQKYRLSNPHPTGEEILALAGKTSQRYQLSQQHGEPGQLQAAVVQPTQKVNLAGYGIESFLTKPLPISVYVNGTAHQVTKEVLSFEELVVLAHLISGPNVSYTLTYRKGPASNPQGSLVAGQSVHVQESMIFNVGATDRS